MGGTARSMAQNAAESAHDELVAVICVERFQNGRDAHGQLAALKELQSWADWRAPKRAWQSKAS